MKQERQLIIALRRNARASLTSFVRKFDIPQSTLYALLAKLEKGAIRRHTCLLDFHALGFHTHAMLLIAAPKHLRRKIEAYLDGHPSVNSFWRTLGTPDYLCEVIFEDEGKLKAFVEEFHETNRRARCQVLHVLEEKGRERFLMEGTSGSKDC